VPFAEDLRWLYASGRFALPLLPLTPLLLTSVSINPHKVTAMASLLNLPTEHLIEIFRYLHVIVPSERVPFRRRTPPSESPSTSSSASVEDDPLGLSEYEMRLLQLALSTEPDIVRLLLEAPLEQRVILERQSVEGVQRIVARRRAEGLLEDDQSEDEEPDDEESDDGEPDDEESEEQLPEEELPEDEPTAEKRPENNLHGNEALEELKERYDYNSIASYRTLHALARTCRTLYPVARQTLYEQYRADSEKPITGYIHRLAA
jgi:hypothetical protein